MRNNSHRHYSKECSRGGNGQCDGIDVGTYTDCECPCHFLWEPYPRVEDYHAWHNGFWGAR